MLWLPYSALLLCDPMQGCVVLARRIPSYSPGTENSSRRFLVGTGLLWPCSLWTPVETDWLPDAEHMKTTAKCGGATQAPNSNCATLGQPFAAAAGEVGKEIAWTCAIPSGSMKRRLRSLRRSARRRFRKLRKRRSACATPWAASPEGSWTRRIAPADGPCASSRITFRTAT